VLAWSKAFVGVLAQCRYGNAWLFRLLVVACLLLVGCCVLAGLHGKLLLLLLLLLLTYRRGLEALVDEGLVASLGLSNCSLAQVEEVLAAAKHKPVCNQVRALRCEQSSCVVSVVYMPSHHASSSDTDCMETALSLFSRLISCYNLLVLQFFSLQIELHPLLAQRKLVGVSYRKGVVSVAHTPLGRRAPDLLEHPVVTQIAAETGKTVEQVGHVNMRDSILLR
jgi:diketogulonate reductase-like aldo/keto reductase